MGQLLLYGIGAILLYNFWAWVIRHIMTHHKGRWISVHILIVGTLSTTVIRFFPQLAEMLGIATSLKSSITIPVVLSYIVYMLLCGGVFYLGYLQQKRTQSFGWKVVVFLVFFLVIASGGVILNIPANILYFSLVAFGEEYVKYVFGYSLFEKLRIHYTDLLLFCLISGFAFAFIENVFYIWYAIAPVYAKTTIMQQLALGLQTVAQRGLVNVGVHGLFTAIIGWCTLSPSVEGDKRRKGLVGMMLGMGMHAVYNVLVAQKVSIVIPIFVLLSYGFVSYILFKSDSLYHQPQQGGIANTPGYDNDAQSA